MTLEATVGVLPPTSAPTWRRETEVVHAQVDGVLRWHQARRVQEQAGQVRAVSREQRLDLARRMEVLRRQHEAIIARADAQLRDGEGFLRTGGARRAVLVHRSSWYLDKVEAALLARGVQVVARLGNGADGVGAAVAEQPDLMLVEDTLPMQTGVDVVREVLGYAPRTLLAVQVAHDDAVGRMLQAGASAVFTRRLPPEQVASGLLGMLLPGQR